MTRLPLASHGLKATIGFLHRHKFELSYYGKHGSHSVSLVWNLSEVLQPSQAPTQCKSWLVQHACYSCAVWGRFGEARSDWDIHVYFESEDCELRGQLTRVFLVGRWVLQGFADLEVRWGLVQLGTPSSVEFQMLAQFLQGFPSARCTLKRSSIGAQRVLG